VTSLVLARRSWWAVIAQAGSGALAWAIVTGVLSGWSPRDQDRHRPARRRRGRARGSWETYLLVAVGISGFVAQQTAFQAGSLEISFPAATVLEPVTAVVLGMAVLQEHIRADGVEWVLIVVSALVMVAATAALARAGVPTTTTGTVEGTAAPSPPTTAPRT
jgi:hypothetical protein